MTCHTENSIKKTNKIAESDFRNFQVLFVHTNHFYREFKKVNGDIVFKKGFGRIISNVKPR